MRLVCPNCDAQYEVDDAVIPPNGRDVQCSNCGQTWFQPGAIDEGLSPPDIRAPEPEPEPEPRPEPDVQDILPPEPEPTPEPVAEPVDEPDTADEEPEPTAPRRQVLDDSIADVLREEAEREIQARQVDQGAPTLEEQPELGLDETAPAPGKGAADHDPKEHIARLRGIDPGRPDPVAQGGARRDLLPDIEEINYTLRATSDRKAQTGDESLEPPRKRGFGVGFFLVLILAGIALTAYVLAPQISAQLPQAEPVLSAYVAKVDALRIGLERGVEALVAKLGAMAE